MTLETGVIAAEKLCIKGINHILEYIQIENRYFTFHNLGFLLYV